MSWPREKIIELLLESGEIARRAKKNLDRQFKSDRSIVTQADREIEALLTDRLEDPDGGAFIIGEETIAQKGEDYIDRAMREEAFVIDPIDGTAPFSCYLPNWGVSIGRMVEGRFVDGAVYMPEFGEMVISTEDGVEEGSLEDGQWRWRVLPSPPPYPGEIGLVAITQKLAKRGRVDLPNPVMSLGAAVVPLVGLLQGRFLSYLGSVRLWDAGGALPLILRLGLHASGQVDGEVRTGGPEVDDSIYFLEPGDPRRWYFRSSLLICHPGDERRMREALVLSEDG